MRCNGRPAVTGRLVMLVFMATLVLVGCNESATDADLGANTALVSDPLEGVLNSTLNYTPTEPNACIDKLADILGLDDDQQQALLAAYTTFRDGIAELRAQVRAGELTIAEAREQAAALRDAFEAELQVILTPEQYDQLQEMRQNRHHRGRGHRDPQARWEAWLEEIGADDDQVAAVMDALEVLRAGMKDLHSQVRNGELTWQEARDAAEALRAAFDEALQTILTPDQYAALQELRPGCGRP